MTEVNPQNVNNSPSPGGDGVQSAASERKALDPAVNQPVQQRVNAAERREKGQQSSLVQTPGEVLPGGNESPAEIADRNRKRADENLRSAEDDGLPQSTRDELEAGKAALERSKTRVHDEKKAGNATNPVDAQQALSANEKSK